MTRQFTRGLFSSLTSFRTILAVILIGGLEVYRVSKYAKYPDVNAWDAITPTLTESLTTGIIGLTWWCFWLLPELTAVAREQALIRYGSPAVAVRNTIAKLVGVLCAASFYLTATVLIIGFPLGLHPQWSSSALSVPTDQPSAFSSQAFAHYFPNPISALIAAGLFTATAYLIVAAIALATSSINYQGATSIAVVSFALWSFICSFSPFPIPHFVDAATLVSLGWALSIPNGVINAALGMSFGIAFIAVFLSTHGKLISIKFLAHQRSVVFFLLLAVIAIATANAIKATSTESSPLRYLFSGTYGSLVTYVLIAAIPLGLTTSFISRMAEKREGYLLYEALRRGGYRQWSSAIILREIALATFFYVLAGGIILFILHISGHPPNYIMGDLSVLLVGLLGLLVTTFLFIGISLVIFWSSASVESVWPIIVGGSLMLGYMLPPVLGQANFAAPYSIPIDNSNLTIPLIASFLTLVLALLLMTVAIHRSSPSNADHIA